jgi:uncharacterized protein with PIN domain
MSAMNVRIDQETWRDAVRERCPQCRGALLVRTRRRAGVIEVDVSFPESASDCDACWAAFEMFWTELAVEAVGDG